MQFEDDSFIYRVTASQILEASAGSGKTTTLVERYLATLLYCTGILDKHPNDAVAGIAAITYTRKAAAEMKSRIVGRLEKRFDDEAELSEAYAGFARYALTNGVPRDTFLERCRAAKAGMLDAIGMARITTIHAFGLGLLRSHPVETDIDPEAVPDEKPASAELSASDAEAFQNGLRKLIDRRDPHFAFLTGALGYETVHSYLTSLHSLYENNDPAAVDRAARDSGYFLHEDLFRRPDIPQAAGEALAGELDKVRKIVKELTAAWRTTAEEKKILAALDLAAAGETYALFQADWSYKYVPLKTDENVDALRKRTETAVRQFALKLNGMIFPPLRACYRTIEAEVKTLRTARKLISFGEIELKLLSALERDAGFRKSAASSVDFLLIDEYQDTSEIQYAIFEHFLFGGHAASFIVGDPKQSIYGFRNASVEVFGRTRERFVETFGADCSGRLASNYRSDPAVVAGVNRVFADLSAVSGGAFDYLPQTAFKPAGNGTGGLYFIPLKAENKDVFQAGSSAGAVTLVETLIDREGFEPGDVMVLARFKSIIRAFNRGMTEANDLRTGQGKRRIEFVNVDTGNVLETPEIGWILGYLRALDLPESDYFMLGLLKSPFFRKNDGDILNMIRETEKFPEARLYEWMKKNGGPEFAIFRRFQQKKNRLGIPDLVSEIVEETGYRAFLNSLPNKNEAATGLVVFLDELRKLQDVELFDLTRFLYRLETTGTVIGKPQVVGERSNVVRAMTVHSAKGLEAPVVLYLAVYGREDYSKQLVYDPRAGRLGCKFVTKDENYANLFAAGTEREKQEETRLAYVALTRAKERFYYVGLTEENVRYKDWWNGMFRPDKPGISEHTHSLADTLASTAAYRRPAPSAEPFENPLDTPAERLEKLSAFREKFDVHPETVTITQLLDIEFERAAFPNKYLLKSFPLEESLVEIAEEDLFGFENRAADTGTFLHSVFERAAPDNFEAVLDESLATQPGSLAAERAGLIAMAAKFYGGEFYTRVVAAAARTEQEWEVSFPVEAGGSRLIVKGTVDKYVVAPDGRGILIDYKLRIGKNVERYARQLNYYAYILKTLGYPADELYLYDISAGRAEPVALNAEESGRILERNAAEIVRSFAEAHGTALG